MFKIYMYKKFSILYNEKSNRLFGYVTENALNKKVNYIFIDLDKKYKFINLDKL